MVTKLMKVTVYKKPGLARLFIARLFKPVRYADKIVKIIQFISLNCETDHKLSPFFFEIFATLKVELI